LPLMFLHNFTIDSSVSVQIHVKLKSTFLNTSYPSSDFVKFFLY